MKYITFVTFLTVLSVFLNHATGQTVPLAQMLNSSNAVFLCKVMTFGGQDDR